MSDWTYIRSGPPGMETTMPMRLFMSDLSPVCGGRTSQAPSPKPCSCGDRSRPNINHRKTIPCWTYIGNTRHNIDKRGRVRA